VHREAFQQKYSASSIFNPLPAFSKQFPVHREAFQQEYLTSSIFIPLEFTFKLIPFPLFAF